MDEQTGPPPHPDITVVDEQTGPPPNPDITLVDEQTASPPHPDITLVDEQADLPPRPDTGSPPRPDITYEWTHEAQIQALQCKIIELEHAKHRLEDRYERLYVKVEELEAIEDFVAKLGRDTLPESASSPDFMESLERSMMASTAHHSTWRRNVLSHQPEPETLGDYTATCVRGNSAVSSIRRGQLTNRKQIIKEYFSACKNFRCSCGTNLEGRKFFLCQLCLVQPYCNVLCAWQWHNTHELSCIPHPGWTKESLCSISPQLRIPIAYESVPIYSTRSIPSLETTAQEAKEIVQEGVFCKWNKQDTCFMLEGGNAWVQIMDGSTTNMVYFHKATGTSAKSIRWIKDENIGVQEWFNTADPLERVQANGNLVRYTEDHYDALRNNHARQMEARRQRQSELKEAKANKEREEKEKKQLRLETDLKNKSTALAKSNTLNPPVHKRKAPSLKQRIPKKNRGNSIQQQQIEELTAKLAESEAREAARQDITGQASALDVQAHTSSSSASSSSSSSSSVNEEPRTEEQESTSAIDYGQLEEALNTITEATRLEEALEAINAANNLD